MTASLGLLGWLAAACSVLVARHAGTNRRELITRACHELRGPLTAARLGLDYGTQTGGLSVRRLRALELELDRATLALEDLGRAVGRGGKVPTPEVASIDDVVTRSAEALRALAAAHGVQLRVTSSSAALVRCDRRRLAQATGNLIANAIEHGGGVVDVRALDDGETVRLEVLDAGPGLPAPVAKLARRARAGHGARGRGLAIVAAIAAQHGGRISAAPSARGARVVLELPAWRAAGGVGASHADVPDPA